MYPHHRVPQVVPDAGVAGPIYVPPRTFSTSFSHGPSPIPFAHPSSSGGGHMSQPPLSFPVPQAMPTAMEPMLSPYPTPYPRSHIGSPAVIPSMVPSAPTGSTAYYGSPYATVPQEGQPRSMSGGAPNVFAPEGPPSFIPPASQPAFIQREQPQFAVSAQPAPEFAHVQPRQQPMVYQHVQPQIMQVGPPPVAMQAPHVQAANAAPYTMSQMAPQQTEPQRVIVIRGHRSRRHRSKRSHARDSDRDRDRDRELFHSSHRSRSRPSDVLYKHRSQSREHNVLHKHHRYASEQYQGEPHRRHSTYSEPGGHNDHLHQSSVSNPDYHRSSSRRPASRQRPSSSRRPSPSHLPSSSHPEHENPLISDLEHLAEHLPPLPQAIMQQYIYRRSHASRSLGDGGQDIKCRFMLSRCTGRKRAVCVGINYRGQDHELKGCVNDAENVRRFLIDHSGFKREDILLLSDKHGSPNKPTRQKILDAMRWLVKNAHPHDSLVFHYSGHGGRTRDNSGEEESGYDEVIFPLDFDHAGEVVDDEIHDTMVKPLPAGCKLTALFDCCHSGTILDLPFRYSPHGRLKSSPITKKAQARMASPADVVLWSACTDGETSTDTFTAGQPVGAMSYAFVKAIVEQPTLSYEHLLARLRHELYPKYRQKPQLTSSHPIDTKIRFLV